MEYNSLEDAELWNRISQGDEDAFSYVYTFYSGGMYKYGYKFTQQIELIEDVVQEVFVHLWKSRSRLSIQKSIKFYLLSSFNINSFDERSVQVQLETGRVRVFHEGREEEQVFLDPGEGVSLMEDHSLRKKKFDLQKAFHWKDGILFFEKTPFSQVVVDLERWYGVDIKVEDSSGLRRKGISGEFNNVYLSDILESLGYAYGFDYTINNKEVTIIANQDDQ